MDKDLSAQNGFITFGELKEFINQIDKEISDDAIVRLGYEHENKDKTLSYFENNVISISTFEKNNTIIFYNYD